MPPKKRTVAPRIAANIDTPAAPKPSRTISHPWRFRVGEWVHVRGFGGLTARIEDGFLHRGMPHFHVRTTIGDVWRVPQIHVSSNPV
ncbi:MAG: hypothetical protein ACO3P8_12350 [Steroidobacteraceae bacterium]